MLELFDDHGNLVGQDANSRVMQVAECAKQRLECLVDSGATIEELKAYTCAILEEITWVSRQTIIDRAIAIKRKGAEDANETN